MLACLLVPAAAPAAERTYALRYGPVELGGYRTVFPEPRVADAAALGLRRADERAARRPQGQADPAGARDAAPRRVRQRRLRRSAEKADHVPGARRRAVLRHRRGAPAAAAAARLRLSRRRARPLADDHDAHEPPPRAHAGVARVPRDDRDLEAADARHADVAARQRLRPALELHRRGRRCAGLDRRALGAVADARQRADRRRRGAPARQREGPRRQPAALRRPHAHRPPAALRQARRSRLPRAAAAARAGTDRDGLLPLRARDPRPPGRAADASPGATTRRSRTRR